LLLYSLWFPSLLLLLTLLLLPLLLLPLLLLLLLLLQKPSQPRRPLSTMARRLQRRLTLLPSNIATSL
jgi:hypothetical protein